MSAPPPSGTQRLNAAIADRYRIERQLGQGGMATVYLAEDLKHKRHVALKVLKPELAAVLGAERFVQEITTTASLSHPHILPLFDSGTADGFLYYVMPYVEGETLRSRLDRETQLGVDEALRITIEIADALSYAHSRGVIHRDIKPENILMQGGRPMVADFGIALAVSAAAGGRMTETGLSLGTPHYMSPEQATAEKEITGRSDIYSLASVLYEMLTGEPPHMGNSAQQIIMKIITETPRPATVLRHSVPQHVADALAQALEKLPADRFATAEEFASALRTPGLARTAAGRSAAVPAASARASWPALAAVGVGALLLGALIGSVALRGRTVPGQRVQFAYAMPFETIARPHISISRDGRWVAQAVRDASGTSIVAVHDLATGTSRVVPGTRDALDPTFSPDGEHLLYYTAGKLLRIPIAGGPATELASEVVAEGQWGESGWIAFQKLTQGIFLVRADGSGERRLTDLDSARHEFGHWTPQFLPGGKALLFNSYSTPFSRSRIEVVDIASGKRTTLIDGAIRGKYVNSGHLLFARDGAIFAQPFDVKKLRLTGTPVAVEQDLAWLVTNGVAGFDVSDNGTLVRMSAAEYWLDQRVVWSDRSGNERDALPERGPWLEPRISPDGRWIALSRVRPTWQLWLFDRTRRVLAPLSRATSVQFAPVWTPDSRALVHVSETPVYDLFRQPIDGSAADTLLKSPYDKVPSSISPDGRRLVFSETVIADQLTILDIASGSTTRIDVAEGSQREGIFSPDGRWLAYTEFDAAGRPHVYVRPADGGTGRRQVSADAGSQPRWTRGGREIVFRRNADMLSAAFDPSTGELGTPTVLFSKPDAGGLSGFRTHGYDVTADGSQFLLAIPIPRPDALPNVVTLNWLDDLKRLVPPR